MLSKSHGESSKKNRVAKRALCSKGGGVMSNKDSYNAADDLISLVYCDIANGISRSQVIDKITKGMYDGMKKPLARRTAEFYFNAAMDRFAVDCDIEAEKLRNMFYGRYEALLEEAIKKNDIFNAKGILDSMAKIFLGVDGKNKTEINVQNNGDGNVKITFGFNNNNEENDVEDAEIQEAEIIEEK